MSTHRWAERVTDFLYRRGVWLILAVVIVAFGVGVMARKMSVDNSLRVWFVEGDEALKAYDEYKSEFGNDETIVVAVTDPDGIYTPAALERIRAASDAFYDLPRVRRVTSVTHGLHVSGAAGSIDVMPLMADGPVSKEEAARVRERVAMNPSFRGTIASDKSDKISLILVDPKSSADYEKERHSLLLEVNEIVDRELRKDGGGAHLGGIGVVYEGLNQASLRDTMLFTTLSYIVVFIGLFVIFRRLIWVGIGMVVVTVAIVATMGVAGATGRNMNMVLGVLPTLIMTIGILDLVHLVDAFEVRGGAERGAARRKLLVSSLAVVVVPCVFNSVTDVIGFLALTSAHMSAIRDLGWLAAVGLAFLLTTVLVFAVPSIGRFGGSRRKAGAEDGEEPRGWTRHFVLGLLRVASGHRAAVLAGTLVALGVSVYGMSRLDVDTYTIGFLDENNPVRRDHHAIQAQFGNYIPMEFTVRAQAKDGLKDSGLLRRMDRMEREFEKNPRVSRTTGLPEIVKRVNQIWEDEEPEAYAIPDGHDLVAERLTYYGFSADGRDHLDDLVTPDYRLTHVTARTGLPTARGIQKTVRELEAIGARTLGAQAEASDAASGDGAPVAAEVEAAGYLPLYVRIIQHITDAQVRSFAIAFFMVAVVLMVLLRSFKLGLLAMIPNLLPATITLGFMGMVGIRLDVATVLIAAIAIGISVNDTSHIMFRFKHELAASPDAPEEAVRRMMIKTGRPVVASSLILMAGFGVLLFASVKSVSYFGLLSSATILSALLADLIITPTLLLTFARGKASSPSS